MQTVADRPSIGPNRARHERRYVSSVRVSICQLEDHSSVRWRMVSYTESDGTGRSPGSPPVHDDIQLYGRPEVMDFCSGVAFRKLRSSPGGVSP
jgi:hypothetical protein